MCYSCSRDITRANAEDSWRHVDGDVIAEHPARPKKPKKPTVIPNNEMEKLFIKYFQHLKSMGSETYLEYHHHFNSTVEFTDEEWAKLQELDVDAFIQE